MCGKVPYFRPECATDGSTYLCYLSLVHHNRFAAAQNWVSTVSLKMCLKAHRSISLLTLALCILLLSHQFINARRRILGKARHSDGGSNHGDHHSS